MTRLLLLGMLERRRGIVINITQNLHSAKDPPRLPWLDVAPLTEWLNDPEHPLSTRLEGIVGSAVPVIRGVTDRIAPV